MLLKCPNGSIYQMKCAEACIIPVVSETNSVKKEEKKHLTYPADSIPVIMLLRAK